MVITAKLKLNTTPEQFTQLRQTQLAYRDALNYVSQYAFAHGKMSNKIALRKGTYNEIRTRFHLPSQMACSVARDVGATYKGLWTKMKQNAAHRKSGRTKKRYKGLDRAPKYVSPTSTYQYERGYSFKKDQQVRLALYLSELLLYTPCRSHRCQKYHDANAPYPAGLDRDGAVVSCPRIFGFGCVEQ